MKILSEYVSSYRVSKEFEIEDDAGEIFNFCKWVIDSDNETDNGIDFDKDSQKKFDALSEDKQDEMMEFINEIKL